MIGIQHGAHAQRHRPVVVGVADREVTNRGHVVALRNLLQQQPYIFVTVVRNFREAAERQTAHASQYTRHFELSKTAVNTIRRLTHIFDKKDAAARIGLRRRSAGRCKQRQIAADKNTFGNTGAQRFRLHLTIVHRQNTGRITVEQHMQQRALRQCRPVGAEVRTMVADAAVPVQHQVHVRVVAESDVRLSTTRDHIKIKQMVQSHGAVPAAQCPYRVDLRIGECPHDVARARGIIAGQVAGTQMRAGAHDGFQSESGTTPERSLDSLLIDRSRRRDQRNTRACTQARGPLKVEVTHGVSILLRVCGMKARGEPMENENSSAIEANRLYWQTDRSVGDIAETLGVSRRALYELIQPEDSGTKCGQCGGPMTYVNRSARSNGMAKCRDCGAESAVVPQTNGNGTTLPYSAGWPRVLPLPSAEKPPAPRAVKLGSVALAGAALGAVVTFMLVRRR